MGNAKLHDAAALFIKVSHALFGGGGYRGFGEESITDYNFFDDIVRYTLKSNDQVLQTGNYIQQGCNFNISRDKRLTGGGFTSASKLFQYANIWFRCSVADRCGRSIRKCHCQWGTVINGIGGMVSEDCNVGVLLCI